MLFTISNFLFNNSVSVNLYHKTNTLNSFLITTILMLFIIISLYLTFYHKSNAVHKVLGLLLSSIFIVFLWIMQTQFLFIYLVYILAFISAVLMLFLSVVLMLPISTLNNNINKNYIYSFFFSIELLENSTLKTVFLLLILCSLVYSVKKLINTNSLAYLFILKNNYNISKQKFIDIIIQLYLFINMFLIIILSQISINSIQTNIIVEEKILGLGVLKDLLYNQYPAFLIISTVVLLVALIGSAIMTKKLNKNYIFLFMLMDANTQTILNSEKDTGVANTAWTSTETFIVSGIVVLGCTYAVGAYMCLWSAPWLVVKTGEIIAWPFVTIFGNRPKPPTPPPTKPAIVRVDLGPTIRQGTDNIDDIPTIVEDAAARLVGDNPTMQDFNIIAGCVRTQTTETMLLADPEITGAVEYTVIYTAISHSLGLNSEIIDQSDVAAIIMSYYI